jgi:hypothetical protein
MIRKLGAAIAVVLAATLAFSGVASAAATGKALAQGPEVYGTANWVWGFSGMSSITMSVKDAKCDGNPVYVFFEADLGMGTIDPTPYRWNHMGCGKTASWGNLGYGAGTRLGRVRLVACVDDFASDTCYRSKWVNNPEA